MVQIGINDDPSDDGEGENEDRCLCDQFYWGLQDANYNLLEQQWDAILNSSAGRTT